MKLGQGHYENFGSYRALDFDYSDLGLTLISGPTGAGKSTVMDAVAWCLFGQTSKEGAVDEVKKWGSEGATKGSQEIDLPGGSITIYRTRGKTANGNDLYWTEHPSLDTQHRGKDLIETQKLLEKRLGVSAELYFMAAYFSQFSKADTFFVSKAKDRRDILEKIADLSLPVQIAEAASSNRKSAKADRETVHSDLSRCDGRCSVLSESKSRLKSQSEDWETARTETLKDLQKKSKAFKSEKQKTLGQCEHRLLDIDEQLSGLPDPSALLKDNEIKQQEAGEAQANQQKAEYKATIFGADLRNLEKEYAKFSSPSAEICPTCLGKSDNTNKKKHLDELMRSIGGLQKELNFAKAQVRSFDQMAGSLDSLKAEEKKLRGVTQKKDALMLDLERAKSQYLQIEASQNVYEIKLNEERTRANPYESQLVKIVSDLAEAEDKHQTLSVQLKTLDNKITALTHLYDLSFELRGQLLSNSVQELEAATNKYLDKYFDGEIKVAFVLDSDKIEVGIQKNGYDCSFRQLSGGQRCLLKLSFGVSLMKAAANKAGIHFDCLFFDESLNGLDGDLKAKAFGLFSELESEHSSVILIDHAQELKSLFSSEFTVSMNSDESTILHNAG